MWQISARLPAALVITSQQDHFLQSIPVHIQSHARSFFYGPDLSNAFSQIQENKRKTPGEQQPEVSAIPTQAVRLATVSTALTAEAL